MRRDLGALFGNGRFECRWVELAPDPASICLWTGGIDDPIHCPIAHGEGRYVHPDPAQLAAAGQVALRYRSPNPNGSIDAIAGVCNAAGNVLGLMPHPENHVIARQHPHPPRAARRRRSLLRAAPRAAMPITCSRCWRASSPVRT